MRTEVLYGVHPVAEALAAGRREFFEIWVASGKPVPRLDALLAAAAGRGVALRSVPDSRIASICGSSQHQGVAARVSAYECGELEDLLAQSAGQAGAPLLALDSLQDPHNLGAILRTALCAGVAAVLLPKDRAAPPTPAVARASAGALEHTVLIQVTNLVRSLEQLKDAGRWVVGLDRQSAQELFSTDLTLPLVLVIGGESSGMRTLVKRTCDLKIAIPQQGPLDSLNASTAAAVALYEIRRQRTCAARSR